MNLRFNLNAKNYLGKVENYGIIGWNKLYLTILIICWYFVKFYCTYVSKISIFEKSKCKQMMFQIKILKLFSNRKVTIWKIWNSLLGQWQKKNKNIEKLMRPINNSWLKLNGSNKSKEIGSIAIWLIANF